MIPLGVRSCLLKRNALMVIRKAKPKKKTKPTIRAGVKIRKSTKAERRADCDVLRSALHVILGPAPTAPSTRYDIDGYGGGFSHLKRLG